MWCFLRLDRISFGFSFSLFPMFVVGAVCVFVVLCVCVCGCVCVCVVMYVYVSVAVCVIWEAPCQPCPIETG